MSKRLGSWTLTLSCLICGCASQPSAPAAGAAAARGNLTATSVSTGAGDRPALLKSAIALGYKKQQRNGETIYCHTEANLGSRFPKTTCLNEDAMVDTMRNMAETQDYLRTAPSRCVSASCGAQ